MRNLVVLLGDQLSMSSVALHDFDKARDRAWMAEVREESTHVPGTKMRTAMFLSAMRHRGHFGRRAPGMLPSPPSFEGDAITLEVLADVEVHFAEHYGSASAFDWPVTRKHPL